MAAAISSGATGGIEDRLVDLHKSALLTIHLTAHQHASELGSLIRHDVDIGRWASRLQHRPESKLLLNARTEFGYAIYSAASGLYLQAYASILRAELCDDTFLRRRSTSTPVASGPGRLRLVTDAGPEGRRARSLICAGVLSKRRFRRASLPRPSK